MVSHLFSKVLITDILIDIFQLPRTLVAHLRLTLFKRGDLSSVILKRLTTSLVVTCDLVNFLLENHTKCFNKVIFSKLIFSFLVLMYCSCENIACFLCLLIILKWTLDYFYDESKHNESITDCNSCNGLTRLERKNSTSTSALETKIILNLLSLTVDP